MRCKHVAILGSGIDGLVAAHLMADRGYQVTLVEEGERIGGPAAPIEIASGYRSPLLLDRGRLRGDLLRHIHVPREQFAASSPTLVATPEGWTCAIDTPQAQAWRSQLEELLPWAQRLVAKPAPPLDPRRDWLAVAGAGLATRRLGKRRMRRLLRIGTEALADWLLESMDDGPVAASLAGPGIEGSPVGPFATGTGLQCLLRHSTTGARAVNGLAQLIDFLARILRDKGVEIRPGEALVRIDPPQKDTNWRLELAEGEDLTCDAIISSVAPQRTLLDLIAPQNLPVDVADSLRAFRSRGRTGVVALALDSRPQQTLSVPGAIFQAGWNSLHDLEEHTDVGKHGDIADRPHLEISFPSSCDSRLAPEGGSVALVHVHGCGSSVEDARLEEIAVQAITDCWPESGEQIVATATFTPERIAEDYHLPGGHLESGEWALDQLLFLRPDASCARTETPIAGLYLCGPGTHPGVDLHGGSAPWAAAAAHKHLRS